MRWWGTPWRGRPILYNLLSNRPLPHSPIAATSSVLPAIPISSPRSRCPHFTGWTSSSINCVLFDVSDIRKNENPISCVHSLFLISALQYYKDRLLPLNDQSPGSTVYVRIDRYGMVILDSSDTTDPESTELTARIMVSLVKRKVSVHDYNSNSYRSFSYHLTFVPDDYNRPIIFQR